MSPLDLVLVTGAVARLTRLVVVDDAGELVRRPILWAMTRFGERGLDLAERLLACPFCSGLWIALAVSAAHARLDGSTLWTALLLALTASYASGHLLDTLDGTAAGSDD